MKTQRRWPRRLGWALGGISVLAVALYLGFQPLVRYLTRDGLNQLKGYQATFDGAGLSVVPLHYWIDDLEISQTGSEKPPLLVSDHLEAGLNWRKLWHRQLVLSVWADGVQLHLTETPREKNPTKQALPLADQLRALVPLDMDRCEIKRSEVVYTFGADRHLPAIRLTNIEATLENLVTRPDLEEGTATLAAAAKIQDSGRITVFVTADPLEKKLTFAGEAKLQGLAIAQLAPVVEAKTGLKPVSGKLDVLVRFESKGGNLRGGVKPVLRDAHVEGADHDLASQLKAGLVDTSLRIFSDRVPGRDAVATIIPIEGTINQPDLQVWPTVLGVVRNAFVEGFSETYRALPPPLESGKQTPLSQIGAALSKNNPAPVRASPEQGRTKPERR